MERLNHHIYLELAKEFNVAVAGPEGCVPYLGTNAVTTSRTFPNSPKSAFVLGSMRAAWHLGRTFRPDLIICGSGVTAPAGLLIARRLRVPLITYLHGLDIVTTHLLYRAIFLPAIRASHTLIANSKNTAQLAFMHGIEQKKITILHPGVNVKISENLNTNAFRQKTDAGNRPILLSVGRLTERKGLYEFIVNCMPELIRQFPDILVLIVGGEANESLGSKLGIIKKLTATIQLMDLANHVKLLGRIDDVLLSQAYQTSQLLLFPVLDLPGDVEGFGMVAVEAAAHGLPTIAFATGGVPDAVSEGVSGYLIEPGNYPQFTGSVVRHLRGEITINNDDCQNFAKKFNWTSFGHKLRAIIRSTILASNHDRT